MSPFLGLAKHGACQSFKTEHNYKTVKSLIISKPTQLIWKQLRGVVKNRYFTVRLTVRVDPPLRSAFWWFFLVCAKTLFWALFCGSKFSHLLFRDDVKKRIFYGQAVCLSVDPALPYGQVLCFFGALLIFENQPVVDTKLTWLSKRLQAAVRWACRIGDEGLLTEWLSECCNKQWTKGNAMILQN